MSGTDARGYWERNASRYDASARLIGRPLPRMLELVSGAVDVADRVLEVAAGTGIVTIAIAGRAKEVVATDYAAAMVEMLERRVRSEGLENVRCEQADLYSLPFDEASFDAVVAANVLHLVPDLPGSLAALRRVLRPGGRLIVPTFLHDETAVSGLVSRVLALTGFPGERRFTSRSLREALESARLRIDRFEILPGPIPIGYAEGVFDGA